MKAIVRGRAWSLGAALAGAELAPEIAEPRAGQGATIDWLVLADRPGTFRARAIWCRAASHDRLHSSPRKPRLGKNGLPLVGSRWR